MSEPTPQAAAPSGLAAVEALLQPFNRDDAPGLVVGIAQGGKTIFRRAFGMASIEHGVANTVHTRMRIASTSKHFTSVAVLLLAEEGKLHIDDLVYQHLPELPVLSKAGPTLRQLMNHTGGWRTDLSAFTAGLAIEPEDWSLPRVVRQSELNFEPGSRMIYSNAGYQLLAKVVERLGGQSLERFLRERIFEPLGMLDTESVTSDFDIRPGLATLHQVMPDAAGGGLRRGIYPSELRGSGSMISTIDDMLRWLAHLRSEHKQVGSAASWAQMIEHTTLSTGTVVPYGLGLMRHPYRGVEVIHHAGAVLGATSQMITVPAHALDIIIMTNGALVSPPALAFKFIDALLADALREPPVQRVQAAAYPALLGTHYHAPATGALISFAEVAGMLGLSWIGNRPVPLRQRETDVGIDCDDIAINPLAIETAEIAGDQAPAALTLSEGGNLLRFERLPAQAPATAELAEALSGTYRAPDLDARARIALEGDTLTFHIHGRHGGQTMRLQPLSADVLIAVSADPLLMALGGGAIVNVDRKAGRVEGLRLDALRTRHLRFVRDPSPTQEVSNV